MYLEHKILNVLVLPYGTLSMKVNLLKIPILQVSFY